MLSPKNFASTTRAFRSMAELDETRVALEIALNGDWARCVAVDPEQVNADDKKAKKEWARDDDGDG